MDDQQRVLYHSMRNAAKYIAEKNWFQAYAHYIVYLGIAPHERHSHQITFENIVFNLGNELVQQGKVEELLKVYNNAIRCFPNATKMYNDIGAHLLRIQQPAGALRYLSVGHSLDSTFLLLEKNLQTAKLNLIPRWHFRMLNDHKRNEAYRTAIHQAITPIYNRVLDIGTGSGLLSYYASECTDVQSIIAVEMVEALAKIARKALKDVSTVKVIRKRSTRLTTADVGLPNILITEIFDAGLFGEHALETMIHAWEHLLDHSAVVIPAAADIFVTGISSKVLLNKDRLVNDIPQLKLQNVCVRQVTCQREPYEAENLKEKSYKSVTNTRKVVNVNFSNIQQLKQIYKDFNGIPPFILTCQTSGTIDCFAIWFDLHLNDKITITTNPSEDNVRCWEQAVIYLDHPLEVHEGDEIKLQLSCVADVLQIRIIDYTSTCEQCFEILPEMIKFLNDVQIVETADDLTKYLPNKFTSKSSKVLDLNPVPLFALFRAIKGIPGHYKCIAIGASDLEFLNYLWRINGIPAINEAPSTADITYEIYAWHNVYKKIENQKFDIIFVNPISENGILQEATFTNLQTIYDCLNTDGILLPSKILLQIELIDSKYLDFCNKVDDGNLLGYKVADRMNKYSILEQWQVEPQHYHRKTLCDIVISANVLTNNTVDSLWEFNLNVPISGTANGVLYWYNIQFLNGCSINTYKSSYYHGACFIFKNPRVIKSRETLPIYVEQSMGLLKITYEDVNDGASTSSASDMSEDSS